MLGDKVLGDKEAPVCIFTCFVLYRTGGQPHAGLGP